MTAVLCHDKRKGAADWCPLRLEENVQQLENQLATELEHARIVGTGDLAKVAVSEIGVDAIELSVVESVEGLSAELEASALGECECLIQRSCEVYATWPDH